MKLNRTDAVDYLKMECMEDYLERKGIPTRGSFRCISGTHADKHPSMSFDYKNTKKLHCFSCGTKLDLFDLIGMDYNIPDFNGQLNKACEMFNVEIDRDADPAPRQPEKKEMEQPKEDYTEYYRRCAADLQNSWTENSYLARRGISKETCRKYNIGIDPHFKTKDRDADQYAEWEVVLIPTGIETYVARNTDKACTSGNRFRNKGKATPFNLGEIRTATQPIFVCEGEIDCLSIIEAGGTAVGLGGINTGVINVFLDAVKESHRTQPYVIALDHETEPEKIENVKQAAETIREGLNELGQPAYILDPYEGYKDANEALQKCRPAFEENIRGINFSLTKKKPQPEEKDSGILWERMKRKSTENELTKLFEDIDRSASQTIIPTGFPKLDELLDGGLHPELYLLYAPTATGKSTFILQISDQIAQAGHRVEFFNLEMSNKELISKSISRHTCINVDNGEANGRINNAKTASQIMTGSMWSEYSQIEKELIAKSVDDYWKYANNIRFHESFGYLDTNDIREAIEYCQTTTGKTPTVFVDYIQMLSLGVAFREKKSITERQAIDKAVLDLKQISREYQCPVIVISAVNREASKSKTSEIELEAGKESGALEYTAGCVLSLDYASRGNGETFNLDFASNENPRKMKVKVLKSRHSDSRDYVLFNLYPRFSIFKERKDK